MKRLKDFGFILIVFVIILALVIARSTNKNLFKNEAKMAIEAVNQEGNLISAEQISAQYLVVDLSTEEDFNAVQFQNVVNIPFKSLLEKPNRKLLEKSKDKIVLYSKDISTSSKAWVILNQLNFKNIFILQTEMNAEVFKYKFQPDTLDKLE